MVHRLDCTEFSFLFFGGIFNSVVNSQSSVLGHVLGRFFFYTPSTQTSLRSHRSHVTEFSTGFSIATANPSPASLVVVTGFFFGRRRFDVSIALRGRRPWPRSRDRGRNRPPSPSNESQSIDDGWWWPFTTPPSWPDGSPADFSPVCRRKYFFKKTRHSLTDQSRPAIHQAVTAWTHDRTNPLYRVLKHQKKNSVHLNNNNNNNNNNKLSGRASSFYRLDVLEIGFDGFGHAPFFFHRTASNFFRLRGERPMK